MGRQIKKVIYKAFDSQCLLYFDSSFSFLSSIVDKKNTIIITDSNVWSCYQKIFKSYQTIVIPAGEAQKNISVLDFLYQSLIDTKAYRSSLLVGVGGGVVTDITGFIASTFMRGIRFGFVPTSLLAMVDASIGGKNGIDFHLYKNMVGVIKQPDFILYDARMLYSLPPIEWSNGFAEVIKHASIKDAHTFRLLEKHTIQSIQSNDIILSAIIKKSALLKVGVTQRDQHEKGERKLLNFGHTLGHAIENITSLSHGQAISVGMHFAAKISEKECGFKESSRLINLLQLYQLPVSTSFDKEKAYQLLEHDKKKNKQGIQFVLLQTIGKAMVYPLSFTYLRKAIHTIHISDKR